MDPKLCINCSHFMPHPSTKDIEDGLCGRKETRIHLVSGRTLGTFAENERDAKREDACGADAKHFEPKVSA